MIRGGASTVNHETLCYSSPKLVRAAVLAKRVGRHSLVSCPLHLVSDVFWLGCVVRELRYTQHQTPVLGVSWGMDQETGQPLVVSAGTTAHVWVPTTGQQVASFRGSQGRLRVVAWEPGGPRIVCAGCGSHIEIWDWRALANHTQRFPGEKVLQLYTGHTSWINSLAWSPDRIHIASASSDGTVQIWEAATGQQIRAYSEHCGDAQCVAWSPGGDLLASASTTVHIWEAATGLCRRVYAQSDDMIYALAWSPARTHIASGGSEGSVHVWDVESGQTTQVYSGHESTIFALNWSPDGESIASGSDDWAVRIWDVQTGGERRLVVYRGHRQSIKALAWSPDGTQIASGGFDGSIHVWEPVLSVPTSWLPFLGNPAQSALLCVEQAHGRAAPWLVCKIPAAYQNWKLCGAWCKITEEVSSGSADPLMLIVSLQHESPDSAAAGTLFPFALSLSFHEHAEELLHLLAQAKSLYVSAFSGDPSNLRYLWEGRWSWSWRNRQIIANRLFRQEASEESTSHSQEKESSHRPVAHLKEGEIMLTETLVQEMVLNRLKQSRREQAYHFLSCEPLTPEETKCRYGGRFVGFRAEIIAEAMEVQYVLRQRSEEDLSSPWKDWELRKELVVTFSPTPILLS